MLENVEMGYIQVFITECMDMGMVRIARKNGLNVPKSLDLKHFPI